MKNTKIDARRGCKNEKTGEMTPKFTSWITSATLLQEKHSLTSRHKLRTGEVEKRVGERHDYN